MDRTKRDDRLGKAAIEIVSAWAASNHLALGQWKVDEQSNEITAFPELLQLLELSGCVVTIDAVGCQAEIAQAIRAKAADFVLAQEENRAQNLAILCRITLNLLKQEHTAKWDIKAKRLKAGWDDAYLLKVLTGLDAIALTKRRQWWRMHERHPLVEK